MKYSLSSTGIDNFLADYVFAAEAISGNSRTASSTCSALIRYVSTCRASTDFVKAMLSCSPEELARTSLKGGSDDDILKRIKRYIKLTQKR